MRKRIYGILLAGWAGVLGSSYTFGQAPAAAMRAADGALQTTLQVRYELYARFQQNDTVHEVTGYEKIHLLNTGSRPLTILPVYLYPNSYSSDSTALCERLLKDRELRLYFARASQLGRISQLDFRAGGERLGVKDPTGPAGTGESLLIRLPAAVQPGDSLTVQTPLMVQLPARLTDLGYTNGISYLKDWFVQVGEGDENNNAPAVVQPGAEGSRQVMQLQLTLNADQELAVSGGAGKGLLTMAPDPVRNQDGSVTYQLEGSPYATLVIQDMNASRHPEEGGKGISQGNDTSAVRYFEKLLPGPLSGKRPERPDSLMAQMTAARRGGSVLRGENKPLKPALFFNLKEADTHQYLSFSPAIGYNNYDRWMPGILIHNYGLPVRSFNFLLAPLYSTADHSLSGAGRLSFTWRRPGERWQASLDASDYAFSNYSSWSDAAGHLYPAGKMRLLRIVPAIRYKWYPDLSSADKSWSVAARSYILRKDSWVLKDDDQAMQKGTTVIGEVSAALRDDRALYPYALELKLQGTDQFIRAGLTGNYFLNYDAKGNGLQLRGFAGKFFYLKQKNIQSDFNLSNYFLNLSGATGAQDFTYSDYYVGRSEYEGWMSQQMAVSDGFFKVSTPYQQHPVGQTDDWLAAVNLTTDLPDGVNPFSVLPFRLPVRVFADFGTYSDLWSENPAAGRFLYDAGLQVSVFKEAVTVYIPVLYSKIYRDIYKSIGDLGGFGQRIRFSICLANLLPKRLNKDLKW